MAYWLRRLGVYCGMDDLCLGAGRSLNFKFYIFANMIFSPKRKATWLALFI